MLAIDRAMVSCEVRACSSTLASSAACCCLISSRSLPTSLTLACAAISCADCRSCWTVAWTSPRMVVFSARSSSTLPPLALRSASMSLRMLATSLLFDSCTFLRLITTFASTSWRCFTTSSRSRATSWQFARTSSWADSRALASPPRRCLATSSRSSPNFSQLACTSSSEDCRHSRTLASTSWRYVATSALSCDSCEPLAR
mmetsp:Transcript_119631/g.338660  ORF Transcript_119631/g.338660 Transcript_119631/m.338660 type:complete len:201 (+) Transcript_119631:723-1325(+)